jgi:hypothetical protein
MIAALLLAAAIAATPDAVVALGTDDGVKTVSATWRYADVKIVETDFKGPDENGKPNGRPIKAYDIAPHAGGIGFDDSDWEVIAPTSLAARRSDGRVSFNWYRLNVRVPEADRRLRLHRIHRCLRDHRGRLRGSLG